MDSFNMENRDEGSILDQTYQKQICSDLICITLYENAPNIEVALKSNFFEFLVVECCISLNMHFQCCLHPYIPC